MRYEFTLKLIDFSSITDEMENSIFSSNCADGLLNSCNGEVYLDFSREAANYNEAVMSAKNDLNSIGFNSIVVNEKDHGAAVSISL